MGFFLKSISLNLYKCQVYDKHAVNSTKVLNDVHVVKEYKCLLLIIMTILYMYSKNINVYLLHVLLYSICFVCMYQKHK